MKQTDLTRAIEEVVELKMRAIDILVGELVEPLKDVGSPEKLLGKSYESWTPQDMSMMLQIYGSGEDSPLTNLIFRKTYARVKELEEAEL